MEMPSASRARHEAGVLLSRDGNRMTMLLGTLVVLSSVALYILMVSVYFTVRAELAPMVRELMASDRTGLVGLWIADGVFGMALVALSELLTVPLAGGLFYMAHELAEERRVTLSDVLHSFSSRERYVASLSMSVRVCGAVLLLYLACYATRVAAIELLGGIAWIDALSRIAIAIEVALVLIWMLLRFGYVYALYGKPEEEDAWLEKESRPYFRRSLRRYWIDYLPWLLLSVASFGILFLADTLPRMLISYFRLCKATTERYLSDRRK